jgi:hypothetical protein
VSFAKNILRFTFFIWFAYILMFYTWKWYIKKTKDYEILFHVIWIEVYIFGSTYLGVYERSSIYIHTARWGWIRKCHNQYEELHVVHPSFNWIVEKIQIDRTKHFIWPFNWQLGIDFAEKEYHYNFVHPPFWFTLRSRKKWCKTALHSLDMWTTNQATFKITTYNKEIKSTSFSVFFVD